MHCRPLVFSKKLPLILRPKFAEAVDSTDAGLMDTIVGQVVETDGEGAASAEGLDSEEVSTHFLSVPPNHEQRG